jgi:hypothetical protein
MVCFVCAAIGRVSFHLCLEQRSPGNRGDCQPMKYSTTAERIAAAHVIYAQLQRSQQHNAFDSLLFEYRAAISRSAEAMLQLGVAGKCGECADSSPGSCCSRGVEDWYDPLLLCINLQLGCDLQESRRLPEGCLFVGRHGCTLIPRHYFCVHFLCPALKHELAPAVTDSLLAVVSGELLLGAQMEQHLYRWVESRSRADLAMPMPPPHALPLI